MTERLAIMCVLPLLLAGVLGAPASQEKLSDYLRKILLQKTISDDSWSGYRVTEVIDAVRFLWLVSLIHSGFFLKTTFSCMPLMGVLMQHF